jgi:hypothetical protein
MSHIQGDLLSATIEVDELHQLIQRARRCVTSLVSKHGDCSAMRRVANDVERLEIDVEELALTRAYSQPSGSSERIQIPDTDYHIDFWRDVDHEGVGGQRGGAA